MENCDYLRIVWTLFNIYITVNIYQERFLRLFVFVDMTFYSEPLLLWFSFCVDIPLGDRGCLACSGFRLSAEIAAVSEEQQQLSDPARPWTLTLPPHGRRKRSVQFSSYACMSKKTGTLIRFTESRWTAYICFLVPAWMYVLWFNPQFYVRCDKQNQKTT